MSRYPTTLGLFDGLGANDWYQSTVMAWRRCREEVARNPRLHYGILAILGILLLGSWFGIEDGHRRAQSAADTASQVLGHAAPTRRANRMAKAKRHGAALAQPDREPSLGCAIGWARPSEFPGSDRQISREKINLKRPISESKSSRQLALQRSSAK